MRRINRHSSKKLDCIKKMPPLKHTTKENNYDIMKSEVVDWLFAQEDVRKWLYEKITDYTGGRDPEFIKYNRDTGTWQGVNYEEE